MAYAKGPRGSCDRLFSQIVRSIGYCQRCDTRSEPLQCAHIVRRGRSAVLRCMTDPIMNGWALCGTCHYKVDNNEEAFLELVDRTLGRRAWRKLKRLQQESVGAKVNWSDERARLRRIWNELEKAA